MLIAVVGDLGSGKTLFLLFIALDSERKVKANFLIMGCPNYEKLNTLDIFDIERDCDILIDEMYTWIESRISGSKLNLYMSYIIFQSRKLTIDIYGTMQLFSSVDVRFRRLVDRIVKCERIDNGKEKPYWDFKYSILNMNTLQETQWELPYKNAEKYFKRFDTFQVIEPFDRDSIELEIMKRYPNRLGDRLEEIALTVKQYLNSKKIYKYTHSNVKMGLLKTNHTLEYDDIVYAFLNVEN